MSGKFDAITTEIKYDQGYNAGYSKEEDLATVTATNLLIKLGIFDRVTLKQRQVVAEKYMVGEDYGKLTLILSMQYQWGQGYDPYVMTQQWFFNDQQEALEVLLSQLDKPDARLLLFNLDTLASSEIDLKEYNKNGLNYS